jgi:cytochrome b
MAVADESRRVWDLPVRIVHWLLVAALVGAYATHKAGVEYFKYHAWCGYTVVVLSGFRILWGFVGTRHARFTSFVRGPGTTLAYLSSLASGRHAAHAGHNPLGAWMVVFLLATLFAQGVTGLFANDEIFNTGPLYGYVSDATSLALTSWHRRIFDWILSAVLLHMAAVLAHRVLARQDLIGPMFSGRKPAAVVAADEAISSSRLWLAVLLLGALAGGVGWLVTHAPEAAVAGFD